MQNINKTDEISTLLNLEAYKKDIHQYLCDNGIVAYILLDKLDEFVLKEEYEIQKNIIQGLLSAERGYLRYSNIKLKVFLRSDIFRKLNFDQLGYEKVASRKIELFWNEEDIREFIAKRIAYNYLKVFDLDSITLNINEELLYLDETSSSQIEEIDPKNENKIVGKIVKYLAKKVKSDSYEARKINFTDKTNRELITSIFPRQVPHKNIDGKKEEISIFQYLSSHFNMSSGKTTPRIMLMFLDKCFERTREYYQQNPDISEVKLENKEYPLIKKGLFVKGQVNSPPPGPRLFPTFAIRGTKF